MRQDHRGWEEAQPEPAECLEIFSRAHPSGIRELWAQSTSSPASGCESRASAEPGRGVESSWVRKLTKRPSSCVKSRSETSEANWRWTQPRGCRSLS